MEENNLWEIYKVKVCAFCAVKCQRLSKSFADFEVKVAECNNFDDVIEYRCKNYHAE